MSRPGGGRQECQGRSPDQYSSPGWRQLFPGASATSPAQDILVGAGGPTPTTKPLQVLLPLLSIGISSVANNTCATCCSPASGHEWGHTHSLGATKSCSLYWSFWGPRKSRRPFPPQTFLGLPACHTHASERVDILAATALCWCP